MVVVNHPKWLFQRPRGEGPQKAADLPLRGHYTFVGWLASRSLGGLEFNTLAPTH